MLAYIPYMDPMGEGNISYLHEISPAVPRNLTPTKVRSFFRTWAAGARSARAQLSMGEMIFKWAGVDGCDWWWLMCFFKIYAPKWVKMEFEASNIGRYWELAQLWMVVIKKVWLNDVQRTTQDELRRTIRGSGGSSPEVVIFRIYRWDTINEELDWTHPTKKRFCSDTQTWNLSAKKIAGIVFPLKMFTAPGMADSVPSMGLSITEPFFSICASGDILGTNISGK